MINNQLKSKPYFDPYFYKQVLEDAWLPAIAKETLKSGRVTHKHKFLFPETKELQKSHSIYQLILIMCLLHQ